MGNLIDDFGDVKTYRMRDAGFWWVKFGRFWINIVCLVHLGRLSIELP
jgi:hypothetical protein